MSKLYQINQQIDDLLERMSPDMETGELPEDYDLLLEQYYALEMQKGEKLQNIAKYALNLRSDIAQYDEEIKRLKKKKQAAEAKYERIMNLLDYECQGTTTALGVATVKYTKSDAAIVTNANEAADYLEKHGFERLVKHPPVQISKTEVKKVIKAGVEVPGVYIEYRTSCSLR